MEIKIFLNKMYDFFWDSTDHQQLIEEYKYEITKEFDSKDFIIALCDNKYHSSFILSNFLFNTELWSDLLLKDWKQIVSNVKRPSNIRFIIDDYGVYCDLIFLYKFLGIDSFSILNECEDLDQYSKQIIFSNLLELLPELYITEYDIENFEDGTYPNYNTYKTVQNKLIDNGAKKSHKTSSKIKLQLISLCNLNQENESTLYKAY